ncbi:MAG TPA: ABC transporter substrate-binding protein [Nocardioidaceae bacterium]|nr:ABC transporter substrate-binding protein [Nocardioidaceae bacterium]
MRRTKRFKSVVSASVLALTSVGLAACGGDEGSGSDGGAVTVWLSLDQSVIDGLKKQVDARAAEEGIEIKLEKVDSIDKVIKTRIEAGDPPDIALVPQPGVVASIVELGAALPLDDVLDMDALEASMVPGTLEAGTVDDQLYGLLVSMNVKSLLFYPKKAFEAAGYELPETLDELTALANKIKSDGGTPWCLTIESGDATGWVVTDWFEDLVMRFGGPDVYSQWVTHEVPFDSEVVREAAGYFEEVAFTDGNVQGGRTSIVATNFNQAAQPMFAQGGPECWLLKQGSFFTGAEFLPANVLQNLDAELGVTGFPPAEAGGESPVLGGGDLAVLFSDSDEAATAMQILSETEIGNEAAPVSSFISPHKDFDSSLYPNETTRTIAGVAYDATTFLFDGSDAMPAQVGAGSFWKEMTAWINGDRSLDDALKNIDDSWPSS